MSEAPTTGTFLKEIGHARANDLNTTDVLGFLIMFSLVYHDPAANPSFVLFNILKNHMSK